MDFRTIRVDDVIFDSNKDGRRGVRYGGNTSVRFQMPRATYRVSSKIPGTLTLTPLRMDFPGEFNAFMSRVIEKSGVNNAYPFERLNTNDETLIFDHNDILMDDIRPGSVVDVSLLVCIKGSWTNGITSGLIIDIDQIKVYSLTEPVSSPKVYMNGKPV